MLFARFQSVFEVHFARFQSTYRAKVRKIFEMYKQFFIIFSNNFWLFRYKIVVIQPKIFPIYIFFFGFSVAFSFPLAFSRFSVCLYIIQYCRIFGTIVHLCRRLCQRFIHSDILYQTKSQILRFLVHRHCCKISLHNHQK